MKGSKQSRTDLLEKKVQATINIIKQLLDENAYLKDLAVGTLETVKLMPGYDKAIEELKTKLKDGLLSHVQHLMCPTHRDYHYT